MIPNSLRAFAVAAIAAALSLQAQTTLPVAPPEKAFIELDAFVVESKPEDGYFAGNSLIATGFRQEVYRTPINISLLTEEFLTDLGVTDLTSAASYLSGVTATPDGLQPNAGFQVRGLRTSWTSRNGLRQYAGVGRDNVDRVEVIKGPASIFFGQVAPGGVINYSTKRASEVRRSRAVVELGTDERIRGQIESQGPLVPKAGVNYRVMVSKLDTQDWRDFEYEKRDFAFGGLQWRIGPRLNLYAEYEYATSEANDAHELLAGNLNWVNDYASPPADLVAFYPGQTVDQVRARWLTNLTEYTRAYTAVRGQSPGTQRSHVLPQITPSGYAFNPHGPQGVTELETRIWTFEGTLQVTDWLVARGVFQDNYNYRLAMGNFSTLLRSATGAIRPSPSISGNENDSRATSVELAARFRALAADHRLLAGLSRYEDHYRSIGALPKPTAQLPAWSTRDWNPNTDAPFDLREFFDLSNGLSGNGVGKRGEDNETRALYATYVGEWMSGRLTTMTGVRDETYDKGTYIQGNRAATFATQEFGGVTPMYGALFEVRPGWSLFGSYSEAYLPGAAGGAQITGNGRTADELRLNVPNQEGSGMDLGIKVLTANKRLSATASVFDVSITNNVRQRDDARTDSDPRNLDTNPANDVVWFFVGGETRSRGLEADVLFRPIDALQVQVSYSWLREAKVVANPSVAAQVGARLANTPEHQGSLWGKYSFKSGALRGLNLGLGARYRDRFLIATQPSPNTSKGGRSLTFDALVSYRWPGKKPSVTTSLNARNLFDEMSLIANSRPAEGRSIVLTTTFDF